MHFEYEFRIQTLTWSHPCDYNNEGTDNDDDDDGDICRHLWVQSLHEQFELCGWPWLLLLPLMLLMVICWQHPLDDCESGPCMNNGTCVDGIHSFSCECSQGFTGKVCDVIVNECASQPCANGATCRDIINGYVCRWVSELCRLVAPGSLRSLDEPVNSIIMCC